jgi:post-segregation antitoxin (ccd killing protein)
MSLELKSLKSEAVALLEADGWTIENLAVATVKRLVSYRGIGRVGAAKAIAEAAKLLNERGLKDANRLAVEIYYQKAPPAKILEDWENDGLPIKAVALTSARALAALKGIDEPLALRLISEAQGIVNKRGLYQSRTVAPGGPTRQTSAAFPEKWLSGEVEPPGMSIRIRRNFEAAQREYKVANG